MKLLVADFFTGRENKSIGFRYEVLFEKDALYLNVYDISRNECVVSAMTSLSVWDVNDNRNFKFSLPEPLSQQVNAFVLKIRKFAAFL